MKKWIFVFVAVTFLFPKLIRGGPLAPRVDAAEIRFGVDGNSRVELSLEKLYAHKPVILYLRFSRVDASKPALTLTQNNYVHFIAVPDGGGHVQHLHPVPTTEEDVWAIETIFDKTGFYQVWVMFADIGLERNIPLRIRVH